MRCTADDGRQRWIIGNDEESQGNHLQPKLHQHIDHENVTKYIASDDDNFNWVEETDHSDEEEDEHNECFNIRHVAILDDNHEMEGCKYMDEINDFELYIVDLTNNIFKQSTEDFNIFEEEEISNEDVTDIPNAKKEERVTPSKINDTRGNCADQKDAFWDDNPSVLGRVPKLKSETADDLWDELTLKSTRGNCADQKDAFWDDDPSVLGRVPKLKSETANDLWDELILSFSDDQKDNEGEPLSLEQKLRNKIAGMTKIRKGLTVDSGAADHVMPVGWLIWIMVMKSVGSLCGLHYVAADGARIPNVGQQLVRFMTIDGTWAEIMFQIAAINKPLVSVSKLIEDGHRVIFDEDNSYILRRKTKKIIKMRKERGVFVIDAYVAKSKKPETGFKGSR